MGCLLDHAILNRTRGDAPAFFNAATRLHCFAAMVAVADEIPAESGGRVLQGFWPNAKGANMGHIMASRIIRLVRAEVATKSNRLALAQSRWSSAALAGSSL